MMDENFSRNLGALLGGARQMQEKLEDVKKELAQLRITGAAGGDMVAVEVNGERKVVAVRVSAEAAADRDMLQDLVAAAINDAMSKVEAAINEKMQASLLGGLGGAGLGGLL